MRPMPCITQTACRARPWAAVPRSRGVGPARAAPLAGVPVGAARAAPLRGRGRLAAAVTVRFRLPRAGCLRARRGHGTDVQAAVRCEEACKGGAGMGEGGGGEAMRGGEVRQPPPNVQDLGRRRRRRTWAARCPPLLTRSIPAASFGPQTPPTRGGCLAQTDLRRGAAVGGGVRGACTACSSEVAPRALAATLKPPARATHGAVRPRPPPRLCGHWNQASRCSPLVWRP
jgi:hypothetical protein